MFEEQQLQNTPSTPPKPITPVQPPAPGQPTVMPPVFPKDPTARGSSMGKRIGVLVVILILLGGIAYAGYIAYQKFIVEPKLEQEKATTTESVIEQPNIEEPVIEEEQPVIEEDEEIVEPSEYTPPTMEEFTPPASISIEVETVGDTDQDGLTDAEEKDYGTSIVKPDTDGDGLTDYEEVMKYETDPLNPDTDGDTYSDGDEIKNGYNPKGEGKLVNLEE
jgi:hypothetical protein